MENFLVLLVTINSIVSIQAKTLNKQVKCDCDYGIEPNYAIALTNHDLEEWWDPDEPCKEIGMDLASVSLKPHNLEDIIHNASICSYFKNESEYNITISELTIWVHLQRHSSVIHDPTLSAWHSNFTTKFPESTVCLFDDFDNYWCNESDKDTRNAILCRHLLPNAVLEEQKYWKHFWAATSAAVIGFGVVMLVTYMIYQKCTTRSTRSAFGESTLFSR